MFIIPLMLWIQSAQLLVIPPYLVLCPCMTDGKCLSTLKELKVHSTHSTAEWLSTREMGWFVDYQDLCVSCNLALVCGRATSLDTDSVNTHDKIIYSSMFLIDSQILDLPTTSLKDNFWRPGVEVLHMLHQNCLKEKNMWAQKLMSGYVYF